MDGSLSPIFSDNTPLTTCTRNKVVITAPASPIIHIPMKECDVKECKGDTPNLLTACMGEKFLWKEDCDMVSLGSPTKVLDSVGSDFVSNAYNSSYFMENSIRYAPLPHESKTNTYTCLVSNSWKSTLDCSSVGSILNVLSNAYINQCVHRLAYSTCKAYKGKRCQGDITPFWILDSGVSLHFLGDKSDFVTFKVLAMPLPIYTANRSTLITSKSIVILKHLSSQNKEVTTTVKSVFFCEDLTCQLLSLGTFLQEGFRVIEDKDHVTVDNHGNANSMTFKPRMANNTIYILQTSDWLSACQSTHVACTVDFETVHHYFGHPSHEVLRQAREHTTNFLEISIPSNNPICSGCMQGKMPN